MKKMRYIDADDLSLRVYGLPNTEDVKYAALQEIVISPTEDVQPVKHGKWIYAENSPLYCKCSECKSWWNTGIIKKKFVKYCPNCGVRMDGDSK